MKVGIVKIGYHWFACQSVDVATKLVALLGKTVEVEWNPGQHLARFTPLDGESVRSACVELTLVDSDQIEKPAKRIPKERRLEQGEALLDPPLQQGLRGTSRR